MSDVMKYISPDVEKDRILFAKDQIVSTATISRQFSRVKLLAKVKPLFITDNGNLDSVLLSYEAYEQMIQRIVALEQEVLDSRADEAERNPDERVDFSQVRRTQKA